MAHNLHGAGAWSYFPECPTIGEFQGERSPKLLTWLGNDSGSLLSDSVLKGWECPKCGAAYAPSEKECWRCNQPQMLYSAA